MAALAVQRPGLSGAAPTYLALNAGGDTVANDGTVKLHFKNASAGSLTIKVDDPTSLVANATSFDPDVTITVAAGAERVVGPFDPKRFGSNMGLAYPGGVTSLTMSAIGG